MEDRVHPISKSKEHSESQLQLNQQAAGWRTELAQLA